MRFPTHPITYFTVMENEKFNSRSGYDAGRNEEIPGQNYPDGKSTENISFSRLLLEAHECLRATRELKEYYRQKYEQNQPDRQPEFINSHQACKFLLVSPRTLANYRKRGYVKYSIVCGKTYYSKDDIAELLKNGSQKDSRDKLPGGGPR